MKRFGLSVALAALVSVGLGSNVPNPSHVLIVINDSSTDSARLGELYARTHGLPAENVCHVSTTPSAAIDRETFETEIRDPIGDWIRAHDLEDRLLYIATTKGLPLWVQGDPGPVGDLASVDSELALLYRHLLGRDDPVLGRVDNPYFAPFADSHRLPPFRRADMDIYLVTRLEPSSAAPSTKEPGAAGIDAAEGVVAVDLPDRQDPLVEDWAKQTRDRLEAGPMRVLSSKIGVPLQSREPFAGYFGDAQSGALSSKAEAKPRWAPNAIALLVGDTWSGLECTNDESSEPNRESPNARPPFVDPDRGDCSENPALRALAEGAAGAIFNVADPTADGYARPQIFFPAYLSGRNLAESAYLATRYLSWREVVVGDPLTSFRTSTRAGGGPAAEPTDSETGGPALFSARRRAVLRERYATSDAVVTLLLKAEFAEAHDRPKQALEWIEASLKEDPAIWEAVWLRARLLERLDRFDDAFEAYRQALALLRRPAAAFRPAVDETALRWKLARLAEDRLRRPELAEPEVDWLLEHRGIGDLSVVAAWTVVKLALGQLDEAESVLLRVARRTDPEPAFALEGLGDIALARNRGDTARRFYRRALAAEGASADRIRGKLEALGGGEGVATFDGADQPEASTAGTARPLDTVPAPSGITRPARVVHRAPIAYPTQAKRFGIEGVLVLRLRIDERGQLVQVKLVRGNPVLLDAAKQGLRNWTFESKMVNGKAEVSWIEITVRFELEKD